MIETTLYTIAELGSDGEPVKYLRPLGVGQKRGALYQLTPDRARAWEFADRRTAEGFVDVLAASNPDRHLEIIELPPK